MNGIQEVRGSTPLSSTSAHRHNPVEVLGFARGAPRTVRVLLLAAFSVLAACADANKGAERIVFIVADTLRQDAVSSYGGWVTTPNLDALAERGQAFPHAVASSHQTTMSMGALFTGKTPSLEARRSPRAIAWNARTWCGVARFADRADRERCIPDELPSLARVLSREGYWTMGVTANPLMFPPFGIRPGFDEWIEVGTVSSEPEQRAARIASRAGDRVNAAVALALDRRANDHFFLYVHYMDVHDYTKGEISGRRDEYADAVQRVDRAVGDLLELLEQRDLLEDALVIFTSDHGERLTELHAVHGRAGHQGNPSFEEVLRVPLIVSPRRFDPKEPARGEDVFRMILRGAGIHDTPASELRPGELFVSEAGWQTYRDGKWKSFSSRTGPRFLLFNLARDPREQKSIAGSRRAVTAKHRKRIKTLAEKFKTPPTPGVLGKQELTRLAALGYVDPADQGLLAVPPRLREKQTGTLLSPDGLFATIRLAHETRGNESALVLEAVRPRGFVWSWGFRNGDKIRSVAGLHLRDSGTAERVLRSIDASGPLSVVVERDGERIEIIVPPNWRRIPKASQRPSTEASSGRP